MEGELPNRDAIIRGLVGTYAGIKETLLGAAQNEDVDAVHVALAQGFDVNTRDVFGNTLLIIASQRGHVALVEFLVGQFGVDITATNVLGNTALDVSNLLTRPSGPATVLPTHMGTVQP